MRINKKIFEIYDLGETPDEINYWLKKTPSERIAAIEMMRRINYGNDSTSGRLQRFFEVAELI